MQPLIYLLTFRPKVECSENDDDAEDVLGALEETMNLNWTSGNRILFHLTDSPHHGKYLEFTRKNYNSMKKIHRVAQTFSCINNLKLNRKTI